MKISHRRAVPRKLVGQMVVLTAAVGAISTCVRAADPNAAYWTGVAGTGRWEDAGNWTVDSSGSVQTAPPGSSTINGARIGDIYNGAATGTLDQATMNWYVANGGLAPNAPLNLGSLVISDGPSANGTLYFNGGNLSVGSLFVGGWPIGNSGVGTLIMNGGTIDLTGSLTVGNENVNATSHGTILMSGGRIDYGSQTISIGNRESTGAVFLSGGSINGTGLVTIGGSTISSGNMATSVGVGSLNISGTGEFVAGNIEFNTGRPNKTIFTTLNDAVSISGGTLSVGSIGQGVGSSNLACTVSFTGGTITANTFRMALTQQGGTLSPGAGGLDNGGASIGSMTLLDDSTSKQSGIANYTQAPGAHLLLDVGSGTNDVVHLENNGLSGLALTATLNGEIDINADSHYTPTVNNTFNVLTADNIYGNPTVHTVNDNSFIFGINKTPGSIPETPDGSTQNTSGSILQIVFLGYAQSGDATRDQTVDSSDFAALAAHYGQSGNTGWAEGDFNGDGIVNALDFNALATNYGKAGIVDHPSGGDAAANAEPLGSSVPEPLSMILIAAGGWCLRRTRSETVK